MPITLAQAAALTGMNRSSILRAIKRGAITGTKDQNDAWLVDGAELARVLAVTIPQPRRRNRTPSRRRGTLTPMRSPHTSLCLPRNASPSSRNASRR